MKRFSRRNTAFFTVIATMSVMSLAGCELLVDFDRTLIDGGTLGQVDGSGFDATGLDSSSEASPNDAASDASDAGNVTDADAEAIDLDADADIDADM
ncbi:MAG: hypothetical protein ACRELY_28110 [Polyangiaceae bacterium]